MFSPVLLGSLRTFSSRCGPRWFGPCLILTALAFGTGCPGKAGTNAVSGKVTLDGKPVSGTVIFVWPDSKELASPIGPDGSYSIPNPPPGQVKILVKGMTSGAVEAPVGGPPPGAGDLPKIPNASTGVQPPAKYGDASTSDLSYEVKAGKQSHDLALKP